MKENKPILTIAIPAYNRTNNLEAVIKQLLNEDLSKFDLLISDDASPNNPTDMISTYKSKMPNLSFIRNKTNLGFSGNVCQLYDLAKTKYIWFICDDDQIIPGCVTKIIDELQKFNPTVAILNHKWTNPYGIEGIAGVKKSTLYTRTDQINDYNILMRMTFLSTLILKRIAPSDEIQKTDYENNVFIQITLGLMLLTKEFKLLESSTLAIERHVGFNYGEFFKFYIVDHLRAIFAINHMFDNKKFIRKSISEIPVAFKLYLSQKLGLFKYRGLPTKRTLREIFYYYGLFGLIILSFVPVYYLVPISLLKFIYRTQLKIIHGNKRGEEIYKLNLNRATSDDRKTKFTEYR